jgi:hypothetical protein
VQENGGAIDSKHGQAEGHVQENKGAENNEHRHTVFQAELVVVVTV